MEDQSPVLVEPDYDSIIKERAQKVFDAMAPRTTREDMHRLRHAFDLARRAHSLQKRKTGEPYILHPIAVATIAAEELEMDVNSVIAAFLHDVVEDTDYTIEDVERIFGKDVAFLVDTVTKRTKPTYEHSRQVDNYRHMLNSLENDVRPLLIKLSDRLHNMRTLSSMRPDKQMKIAGETDYFYAPLANRLGLYNVKIELENLSFRFRCPNEYAELATNIERDREAQSERLQRFCDEITNVLTRADIEAKVYIVYRSPYSVWRKMHKYGDDFNHLKYRHFTDIVFPNPKNMSEKEMALKIYAVLTDHFKEKPGGITNYIDSPKENGYQSFHVKLLADFGRWQEVHISSERMIRDSQLGCMADRSEDNIRRWIEKFRQILRDIAVHHAEGTNFIENVVTSFYNDDIQTFTPDGRSILLPQKATILDFAYEVDSKLGAHAKYARVNNFLSSIKAPLRRGDVVEVFTDPDCHPQEDWLDHVVTYKARNAIRRYLDGRPKPRFERCPHCKPIPGEDLIGFKDANGEITLHKRDCPIVIKLASQRGDDIVSVDFEADSTLYPTTIVVTAVDRYHLFIDLVECITEQLHLTINSFNTETTDSIVTCTISFSVHSALELESIIRHISVIEGVDEVKEVNINV